MPRVPPVMMATLMGWILLPFLSPVMMGVAETTINNDDNTVMMRATMNGIMLLLLLYVVCVASSYALFEMNSAFPISDEHFSMKEQDSRTRLLNKKCTCVISIDDVDGDWRVSATMNLKLF